MGLNSKLTEFIDFIDTRSQPFDFATFKMMRYRLKQYDGNFCCKGQNFKNVFLLYRVMHLLRVLNGMANFRQSFKKFDLRI
ncbi:hypothetical protein BH10PSE4_BH10PSE4_10820 [soil metagenome]